MRLAMSLLAVGAAIANAERTAVMAKVMLEKRILDVRLWDCWDGWSLVIISNLVASWDLYISRIVAVHVGMTCFSGL